jgi:hypothetical protein
MRGILCAAAAFLLTASAFGVTVKLDVEQVKDNPKLVEIANQAKALIEEWHPRLVNMMPTPGFEVPSEIDLIFIKSDKGIAWASGSRITVASDWIEKRPHDIGLVFHELIHVHQRYARRVPSWVLEGYADYMRWGIYEGKPLSWFSLNEKKDGYLSSYQVTAGFFLWLESDRYPGIMSKLNTAGRRGEYKDSFFEEQTGASLESLWADYVAARKAAKN